MQVGKEEEERRTKSVHAAILTIIFLGSRQFVVKIGAPYHTVEVLNTLLCRFQEI